MASWSVELSVVTFLSESFYEKQESQCLSNHVATAKLPEQSEILLDFAMMTGNRK